MAAKKKKRPAAKIVLNVDRHLESLWKSELAKLEKASREGAQDWDDRYEAIGAILEHEPPLYLAGGYATDQAFIAAVVREDRTVTYRNVRVAKYASADDIERFGSTKLELALKLIELKNGPLKERTPVAFEKLRCTFHDGEQTITRSFPDCSVDELRQAIALAKGRESKSKKASPAARAVAASVKKAGVKGVTFSVSAKTLSLRVPLEGVAKVARALVGFVPPGE